MGLRDREMLMWECGGGGRGWGVEEEWRCEKITIVVKQKFITLFIKVSQVDGWMDG